METQGHIARSCLKNTEQDKHKRVNGRRGIRNKEYNLSRSFITNESKEMGWEKSREGKVSTGEITHSCQRE
jgi:hypothetical protein